MILALAVGGWLFFSRKAHALTDKDTIVLADFTNSTGDPVFDGTLRQGLSVQLEQSPFLSHYFRGTCPADVSDDGPEARCAAHPGDCSTTVPADRECGRPRPARLRTLAACTSWASQPSTVAAEIHSPMCRSRHRQRAGVLRPRLSGPEAAPQARRVAQHGREVQHAD